MTDLDLLLRAVLENPDEDTPRLIYADALEEAGKPERAEFIRVQCELARLRHQDDGTDDPRERKARFKALAARERDVFDAWCRRGLTEQPGMPVVLPHFREVGGSDLTYARGFVESLTCAADDWLAYADDILERHPVRAVRLTTWPRADLTPGSRPESYAIRATSPEWFARHLAERWPRIAFTLPPVGRVVTVTREDIVADRTGEMFRRPYPPRPPGT